jgi:SulP family sulfate permease
MTNINNGGKTPVAGIIHAIVLLLIFLFLMPYAVYIPLSCLAAILVMVAYNMSEWRTFKYLLKGDRADMIVLLITFFLTVLIDLTVAIEVGLLMAIILFVKRVSETSSITVLDTDYLAATESEERAQLESTEQLSVPKGIEIFEIDGPFFFGLASKMDELDRQTKQDAVKVRIIRMRKVPFIDSTGVNNLRSLHKRSKKSGIQVILSGVQENVYDSLEKFGLLHEIGNEHIFSHIIPALAKATEMVMVSEQKKKHSH